MIASARDNLFRAVALAGAIGVASVLSLAAPLAASAASAIPAGTTITGTLLTGLDSGKANVGDQFTIAVARPYPNGDVSYSGARIHGHVASVVRAGQGRKAQLGLAFDSIVLTNGASSPLSGHVLHVDQKQKSAVLQQAAGAGVGMIVGNILGKKLLGTNLGGLAGAAGGFVYANNLKTNFTVPQNSTVTIQTDHAVARPQARR